MIQKLGKFAACLSMTIGMQTAPMQAETPASFDFLKSYYALDPIPLAPTINETTEVGGVRSEHIVFDGFDNEKIHARLDVPTAHPAPKVVILLHGITQSYDQWWRTDGGAYSFPSAHRAALVDAGYAVIAIDLRNHGRRIAENDFENPYAYLEQQAWEALRKMISQSVLDVRRTVAYLDTRDDLNTDEIALVGFSLGAYVGFLSTAVEDRISDAVLLALPTLPPTAENTPAYTAPAYYVPGFAGKDLLFVGATNDQFYTMDELTNTVAMLGTANTELTTIEGGHDFPTATSDLTLGFLQKSFR